MTRPPTRRRFLAISAAACLAPWHAIAARDAFNWSGSALGAEASLVLVGLDRARAAALANRVEAEIARLEEIFSLYRPSSALARLNRDGMLAAPPQEFLEVLSLASVLQRATGGAFDPSVQPLWNLYARDLAEGRGTPVAEIAATLRHVGWNKVRFDGEAVRFGTPGMALTLNGIAQGAITDRIAALLRNAGLRDVLVNAGEIAGAGRRPDGTPWQAGIATPDGALVRRITLSDRALASSAPGGTLLDAQGRKGHILDPRTGSATAPWRLVSVSAPRAALADGLSTAFALMERHEIDTALSTFPEATLEALL